MSAVATNDPVLEIDGLEHHLYDRRRGEEFVVYVRQSLVVPRGCVVAIVGPSGCGKTTLLSVAGLLRAPSHLGSLRRFRMRPMGEDSTPLEFDLKEIWARRRQRVVEELRRRHIGFALQSGELVPALTVRENIAAPLRLNGFGPEACRRRVNELLDAFHLRRSSDLEDARVNRLAGGEYQRTALARAISHRPALVFVDEPTAALNRELAWGAIRQLRLLQTTGECQGATIMITHDEQIAEAFADMIVRMSPVRGQAAGEVVDIKLTENYGTVSDSFDLSLHMEDEGPEAAPPPGDIRP